MDVIERRIVNRREDDDNCPHDCQVCYRYNLQMKWLISGAVGAVSILLVLVGIIFGNKSDIGLLAKDAGIAKLQMDYTVASINDIKKAMGLQIRMPSRLEALKDDH